MWNISKAEIAVHRVDNFWPYISEVSFNSWSYIPFWKMKSGDFFFLIFPFLRLINFVFPLNRHLTTLLENENCTSDSCYHCRYPPNKIILRVVWLLIPKNVYSQLSLRKGTEFAFTLFPLRCQRENEICISLPSYSQQWNVYLKKSWEFSFDYVRNMFLELDLFGKVQYLKHNGPF